MPDGGFDVSGVLAQAAQGKVSAPAAPPTQNQTVPTASTSPAIPGQSAPQSGNMIDLAGNPVRLPANLPAVNLPTITTAAPAWKPMGQAPDPSTLSTPNLVNVAQQHLDSKGAAFGLNGADVNAYSDILNREMQSRIAAAPPSDPQSNDAIDVGGAREIPAPSPIDPNGSPAPFDVGSALSQAAKGQLKYTPTPAMMLKANDAAAASAKGRGGLANFVAGANNAILGDLGAPIDIATGAMNLIPRGINAATGSSIPTIQNPVGGSDWLKDQFGKISVDPRTVQPANEWERMMQGAGGAVAQVPMMALGGAGLARIASGLPKAIGNSLAASGGSTGLSAALTALAAGTGGATGQLAEDKAPETLKPYANFAGNLVGASGAAYLPTAAKTIFRPVASSLGNAGVAWPTWLGGPGKQTVNGVNATNSQLLTKGQQLSDMLGSGGVQKLNTFGTVETRARELEQQLAAPGISDADRVQAQRELNVLQPQREQLVPGNEPTVAQLVPTTPDATSGRKQGTVDYEQSMRTINNPEFAERKRQQNNANAASLQGLAPGSTGPEAVSAMFLRHLDAMDAARDADVSAATAGVTGRVAAIGEPGSAIGIGQGIRDDVEPSLNAIDQSGQSRVAGATTATKTATDALGGKGAADYHGNTIRGFLDQHNQGAKILESRLWDAIDPDGNLALSDKPAIDAAHQVKAAFDPKDWPDVNPVLRRWVNTLTNSNGVQAFSRFRQNYSDLASDIRTMRGAQTPDANALRLLGMLKDGMQASVQSAIDGQVAHEAQAVASGAMAPGGGIADRFAAFARESGNGSVESVGSREGDVGGAGGGSDRVSGAGGSVGEGSSGRGTFDPNNPNILAEQSGLSAGRRLPAPPQSGEDLFGGNRAIPTARTTGPTISPQDAAEPPEWAAAHASNLNGDVAWHDNNLALIRGRSVGGNQVYVPAKEGVGRARVDLNIYTGRDFSPADLEKMKSARDRIASDDAAAEQQRVAAMSRTSRWPNGGGENFRDMTGEAPSSGHEPAGDWTRQRGMVQNHEHIAVVDNKTGEVVHAGTNGQTSSVGFDHANALNDKDAYTLHHNHPNSTTLSSPDVEILANPGISQVVAHGHDGTTSSASISPRLAAVRSSDPAANSQNATAIRSLYRTAMRLSKDIVLPLLGREVITHDEATKSLNDVANRILHAKGDIEYASTYALPEPVRDALKTQLKALGYDDDRSAVALGVSERNSGLPARIHDGSIQGSSGSERRSGVGPELPVNAKRATEADAGGLRETKPGEPNSGDEGQRGETQRTPQVTADVDLSTPLTGSRRKAETFHDFVIRNGGVQDPGGDYAANDLDLIHHRGGGRLINPNGLHPDKMRELAIDETFLPQNSDINAFNDKMTSRNPEYRAEEVAAAGAKRQERTESWQEDEARYNSRDAVNVAADESGVRLSPEERDHATDLHMRGVHADDAIRQATDATADTVLQRNAEHNNIGSPGVPPGSQQSELPVTAESNLTPNWDQRATDARNAANQATIDRKTTFHQGPVGTTLRPGPNGEDFRTESAAVPRQFLTGNGAEPARVQKYIEAVGGLPQAVSAMREAFVSDLRTRGILQADGTLKPKQFAEWRQDRARTIEQFPGLDEGLENAASAQKSLSSEIEAHANAVRDFRKAMGFDIDVANVPNFFLSRNAVEPGRVAAYIKAVGGKPQAVEHMSQGLVSELYDRNIIRPDGTIDTGKFAGFQRQRAQTIDQFPGLGDKFKDAQSAQITLDKTIAKHVDDLRDFQNGAAKHFLKADPQVAVGRVFSSGNSTGAARSLYNAVKDDPDALAGLRRGFIDHLDQKFNVSANPEESGKIIASNSFRDFMDQHRNAYKIVFGGQGAQNIEMVEAAMMRTNRAQQLEATLNSNSVQKAIGAAKHGALSSKAWHTGSIAVLALVGEQMGALLHGSPAAQVVLTVGLPVAAHYINAMRQAGIQTMNDLGREMMLHPDLARTLLQRVDAQKQLSILAQKKVGAAIQAAMLADMANTKQNAATQ